MAMAAIFAIMTIISCSKDEGVTYYSFDLNYHSSNNSDFHAINQALGDRHNAHFETENKARGGTTPEGTESCLVKINPVISKHGMHGLILQDFSVGGSSDYLISNT